MSIRNGKHGYRLLLKTAKSVFKQDTFTLNAAREKLREEFLRNRDERDSKTLSKSLFSSLPSF